jgi:hypothetical protein
MPSHKKGNGGEVNSILEAARKLADDEKITLDQAIATMQLEAELRQEREAATIRDEARTMRGLFKEMTTAAAKYLGNPNRHK